MRGHCEKTLAWNLTKMQPAEQYCYIPGCREPDQPRIRDEKFWSCARNYLGTDRTRQGQQLSRLQAGIRAPATERTRLLYSLKGQCRQRRRLSPSLEVPDQHWGSVEQNKMCHIYCLYLQGKSGRTAHWRALLVHLGGAESNAVIQSHRAANVAGQMSS